MAENQGYILLVHGSFHDQTCWDLLIPELQELGFDVEAVTLPGHEDGNKSSFGIKLTDYVNHVVQKIQKIGSPVILLGHSMAGAIISIVAEQHPDLVKQLIYLTAIVPRNRDTMVKLNKKLSKVEKSVFEEAFRLPIKVLLKGRMSVDSALAKQAFYSEQKQEMQEDLTQKIVHQPIRPFFGKIKWTNQSLGKIKKSYIECSLDRALPIAQQRICQQHLQFSMIKTLESDHSPFYLMPRKLAYTIKELL